LKKYSKKNRDSDFNEIDLNCDQNFYHPIVLIGPIPAIMLMRVARKGFLAIVKRMVGLVILWFT
jgi:hypothetical protein